MALRIKVEHDKSLQRSLALTLFQMLKVFNEGGRFLDMAGHLYSEQELQRYKTESEEAEALRAEQARFARFQTIARKMKDA